MADREFKKYKVRDGDGYTFVQAHEVTKETEGDVQVAGTVQSVKEGDVLVKTARPDNYNVLDKETFNRLAANDTPTTNADKQKNAKK